MDNNIARIQAALLRLMLFLVTWGFCAAETADAQGARIIYGYDQLGRLTSVTGPAGSTATYKYDAAGNIISIARSAADQLSVIDFLPRQGAAGTLVTLSGSGFSAVVAENQVRFNGAAAALKSATPTQIVASVPTGATTGVISVSTSAGTAHSSAPFVVNKSQAPTITGFSPAIGAAGTALDIRGENFSADYVGNAVRLNGHNAGVSSGSTVSLTATVPRYTSSGRITVATAQGVATSSEDFFVVPPSYAASDVEVTGRIGIGESKSVTITNAGKKGLIVFEGVAGQRLSVQLSGATLSNTSVSILGPDGASLNSVSLYSSASFIEAFTLPSNGTFTVFVNPSATAKGSVTIALHAVHDVVGTISPGQPAASLATTTPGQNVRLSFTGMAGQRISMSVSHTLDCPAIQILKPDGTVLAGTSVTCGSSYFIDTTPLPAAGTYTIVVNPREANIGRVTLALMEVPADLTGEIGMGGAAVSLTTATPGQNIKLSFTGIAGQRISMNVSHNLDCPGILILKPDGTILAGTSLDCSASYFFDATLLPFSGNYTILVNPRGTNVGRVTLTLMDVPPDATGELSIGGPALTLATTVPGQNIKLGFTGVAGQRISMTASHNLYCPAITVLKPDGTSLAGTSGACGSSYFIDTTVLPVSGTYTILVNPRDANLGRATLTLMEVPRDLTGETPVSGPAVSLTTTVPGQNIKLSFAGATGQRISMTASHNLYCPAITVLKPDGSSLAGTSGACGSSYFIDTTVLPVSGTYSVVVNPRDNNVGSVTLTVMDVPVDAGAEIIVGGGTQTLITTVPGQNARLSVSGTAGQKTRLAVSKISSTLGCSRFSMLKADGVSVWGPNTTCGASYSVEMPAFPASGNYTIVMDPSGAGTGSATFAITAVGTQ